MGREELWAINYSGSKRLGEGTGSAERRGGKAVDTSLKSSRRIWPLGLGDPQRSTEVEGESERDRVSIGYC